MSCRRNGFSLIDTIVGIALMLILFMSLYAVLQASLALSAITKAAATGTELANTQMEYLRGLSYDSLGTVGGIPAGLIPQLATTTVDGVKYTTRTFIEYRDDPADGSGVSDANHVTTDYKLGKVTVSYSLHGNAKSVDIISNFSPPSLETSTGGGTLSVHVINAANANVSDADVRIVNTAKSPSIDFTTFTNTDGYAIIGGAATSSQYQVYITKSDYSSAQTYARTSTNVNPTPGYFTVSKDQVTGATFYIDLLASLTMESFSPATTTTFSDTFSDASKLASQTSTQVASGALKLASQALSGTALSIPISPSYLDGWGILQANISTTTGTSALIHVNDDGGNLIPDAMLPGNSSGFSTFPVSLTNISTTNYPDLVLEADLTSNSTTTTPSVLDWSLSYTQGPLPLPNVSFTLTGTKTIGTNASSSPIYKTIVSSTTGATASLTTTIEYDSYKLSLGSNLIESCSAAPYVIAPGSDNTATLLVGSLTTNTLPLIVETNASSTISNAKVVLTKSGYAATVPTSDCGLAFFSGLTSGTYSAVISAIGHATTTYPTITVSGHTATTTLILP